MSIMSWIAVAVLVVVAPPSAWADVTSAVRAAAGKNGVVFAVDQDDRVLVDVRGDQPFIPASILKVFTAFLAAKRLGLDYRFATEFFVDGDRLVVRGRGDPFLVSEELDVIAETLRPRLTGQRLKGIVIDDSYFATQVRVPGVGRSANPYDALNSATAVNFNTIAVLIRGRDILPGEPQTPLTPFARSLARTHRGKGNVRFQIGDRPDEVRRYAGELIAAKLRAGGTDVGDEISEGRAPADKPLYVHRNTRPLAQVCERMLDTSSNYVANQVFLAVGAASNGAPASLSKSLEIADELLGAHPQLAGIRVVEGSGIAYENRVTGRSMAALLGLFEPYEELLKLEHGTRHKTGTLRAVATLAGYLQTERHGKIRYVIALDGKGQEKRWKILETLKRSL